jgi:hypothetical protein
MIAVGGSSIHKEWRRSAGFFRSTERLLIMMLSENSGLELIGTSFVIPSKISLNDICYHMTSIVSFIVDSPHTIVTSNIPKVIQTSIRHNECSQLETRRT